MINIVCLKWGEKYGPEYVNRLFYALQRHVTVPYRFWCLTDNQKGIAPKIRIFPLRYAKTLDHWWNKIQLFSGALPFSTGERIFYIDLDTLIVSNIDDLLRCNKPKIIVLRDFYHGIARTAGNVGSGLMSWRQGDYLNIWERFIENHNSIIESAETHGDQWWIEQCLDSWQYWQDLFPNRVVSFKIHCQQGIPNGASVICYHGRPGIPESATYQGRDWKWAITPQPWVLDHWKDQ